MKRKELIRLDRIAVEMTNEAKKARRGFTPYNSLHEGYAVLLEEVEELWQEIKNQPDDRNTGRIRSEAIQVGAVAMLMILDLLP